MAISTINQNDSGSASLIKINDNFTDLDTTKADLASPTFSGTPTAPTPTAGDNSTKLATTAFVASAAALTIETTAGVTHSLVTIAGQKVIVWVSGQSNFTGGTPPTVALKYNTVTKHSKIFNSSSSDNLQESFSLMYTETPGAATQNITVETTAGTLSNVVIIVMKIG